MPDLHESTGGQPAARREGARTAARPVARVALGEALLAQLPRGGPVGVPRSPHRVGARAAVRARAARRRRSASTPRSSSRSSSGSASAGSCASTGPRFRFRYDARPRRPAREPLARARATPARESSSDARAARRVRAAGSRQVLTREHRLFGALFEESSDAAFLMDPVDDRIVEANHAGCALLGYTREELLDHDRLATSTRPRCHSCASFSRRALRDGRASMVKFTCRTKTGHVPADRDLDPRRRERRRGATSSASCRTAASTAADSAGTQRRHSRDCEPRRHDRSGPHERPVRGAPHRRAISIVPSPSIATSSACRRVRAARARRRVPLDRRARASRCSASGRSDPRRSGSHCTSRFAPRSPTSSARASACARSASRRCRSSREETTEPSVIGWMPAAAVYFRDPDGHLLEYLAMLDEPPRPDVGIVPWSSWR